MRFIELNRFFVEKLRPEEKMAANDAYAKFQQHKYPMGKIFAKANEQGRVIIDMGSVPSETEELKIPKEIEEALDKLGFFVTDYRDGKCKKKDKSNMNVYRIGAVLQKAKQPELIAIFQKRLAGITGAGEAIKPSGYRMVVTYNPYDVAGMSTDKSWTSCMNLRDGAYCETPMLEIERGGFVAYLINKKYDEYMKSDPEEWIDRSCARIAVKRFVPSAIQDNEFSAAQLQKSYAFGPEKKVYGDTEVAREVKFFGRLAQMINESNAETMIEGMHYILASRNSYSDTYGGGSLEGGMKFNRAAHLITAEMIEKLLETNKLDENSSTHEYITYINLSLRAHSLPLAQKVLDKAREKIPVKLEKEWFSFYSPVRAGLKAGPKYLEWTLQQKFPWMNYSTNNIEILPDPYHDDSSAFNGHVRTVLKSPTAMEIINENLGGSFVLLMRRVKERRGADIDMEALFRLGAQALSDEDKVDLLADMTSLGATNIRESELDNVKLAAQIWNPQVNSDSEENWLKLSRYIDYHIRYTNHVNIRNKLENLKKLLLPKLDKWINN